MGTVLSRLRACVTLVWFPYTISVSRQAQRPRHHTSQSSGQFVAGRIAVATAGVALGLLNVAPAIADGTTATINVAVRSVAVAPTSTTFDTCRDSLGNPTGSALLFPNGNCNTTGSHNVTITNGQAAGHIDVQGADAIPADNLTRWTLCGGSTAFGGSNCTGSSTTTPGQDQFREYDCNPATPLSGCAVGPNLTTTAQCDTAFDGGAGTACTATSGQTVTEILSFVGPASSTDSSTTLTTLWTWTAVP